MGWLLAIEGVVQGQTQAERLVQVGVKRMFVERIMAARQMQMQAEQTVAEQTVAELVAVVCTRRMAQRFGQTKWKLMLQAYRQRRMEM